ncbi:DUF6157 family protein [Planctomycetota bacterium]
MTDEEYERRSDLFPTLEDTLPLCATCSLCQQAGLGFVATEIVWGNGPRDARLMIVGEDSAGGNEDEALWRGSRYTLIPFTNKKSGAKLRILLHRAGVDPFSAFITNTVKCNVGFGKDHPRYGEKVRACLQHLRQEIATIKPQVVVTLGEEAASRVQGVLKYHRPLRIEGLGSSMMLSNYPPFVGSLTEKGPCEIEVFHLWHPSRVNGETRETRYQRDLEVIGARRPLPRSQAPTREGTTSGAPASRASEARAWEPDEPIATTRELPASRPYREELIEVAEDCPVDHAVEPPDDRPNKTRARIAYEMLSEHPYQYTEIEFFHELDVVRRCKPNAKIRSYQIKRFPLVQKYGWGIHRNQQGKLALVAMESDRYRELQRTIKRTKSYRKSRA